MEGVCDIWYDNFCRACEVFSATMLGRLGGQGIFFHFPEDVVGVVFPVQCGSEEDAKVGIGFIKC